MESLTQHALSSLERALALALHDKSMEDNQTCEQGRACNVQRISYSVNETARIALTQVIAAITAPGRAHQDIPGISAQSLAAALPEHLKKRYPKVSVPDIEVCLEHFHILVQQLGLASIIQEHAESYFEALQKQRAQKVRPAPFRIKLPAPAPGVHQDTAAAIQLSGADAMTGSEMLRDIVLVLGGVVRRKRSKPSSPEQESAIAAAAARPSHGPVSGGGGGPAPEPQQPPAGSAFPHQQQLLAQRVGPAAGGGAAPAAEPPQLPCTKPSGVAGQQQLPMMQPPGLYNLQQPVPPAVPSAAHQQDSALAAAAGRPSPSQVARARLLAHSMGLASDGGVAAAPESPQLLTNQPFGAACPGPQQQLQLMARGSGPTAGGGAATAPELPQLPGVQPFGAADSPQELDPPQELLQLPARGAGPAAGAMVPPAIHLPQPLLAQPFVAAASQQQQLMARGRPGAGAAVPPVRLLQLPVADRFVLQHQPPQPAAATVPPAVAHQHRPDTRHFDALTLQQQQHHAADGALWAGGLGEGRHLPSGFSFTQMLHQDGGEDIGRNDGRLSGDGEQFWPPRSPFGRDGDQHNDAGPQADQDRYRNHQFAAQPATAEQPQPQGPFMRAPSPSGRSGNLGAATDSGRQAAQERAAAAPAGARRQPAVRSQDMVDLVQKLLAEETIAPVRRRVLHSSLRKYGGVAPIGEPHVSEEVREAMQREESTYESKRYYVLGRKIKKSMDEAAAVCPTSSALYMGQSGKVNGGWGVHIRGELFESMSNNDRKILAELNIAFFSEPELRPFLQRALFDFFARQEAEMVQQHLSDKESDEAEGGDGSERSGGEDSDAGDPGADPGAGDQQAIPAGPPSPARSTERGAAGAYTHPSNRSAQGMAAAGGLTRKMRKGERAAVAEWFKRHIDDTPDVSWRSPPESDVEAAITAYNNASSEPLSHQKLVEIWKQVARELGNHHGIPHGGAGRLPRGPGVGGSDGRAASRGGGGRGRLGGAGRGRGQMQGQAATAPTGTGAPGRLAAQEGLWQFVVAQLKSAIGAKNQQDVQACLAQLQRLLGEGLTGKSQEMQGLWNQVAVAFDSAM